MIETTRAITKVMWIRRRRTSGKRDDSSVP